MKRPGTYCTCKFWKVILFLGHFAVSPAQVGEKSPKNRSCEKLWLVVRSLESPRGYQVNEGDVIKMGRLKFRVKELKGADPSKRVKNFNLQDLIHINDQSDDDEEEQGAKFTLPCRICLSECYTDENPLICPCNCDGTMKYIHLKCLQRALRSKVTTRSSESALSFSWKSMSCDLCKRHYPYKFVLNGTVVELIQIPKPPEKYVILEGLCKDKNSSKWLHVVSLNSKDSIKFGRANDCELRMSDISVSRLHGCLKLNGENFYLEDKGSKFGTLVQIKRPVALEVGKELVIQSGRTMLHLGIKKPWSLIPACFRTSSSPFDLYGSPYHPGVLPLLPINTGIPLSIEDPEELLERAGIDPMNNNRRIQKKKSAHQDNLMFEHGQLGMNSSLEDEDENEGIQALQEVGVADMEDVRQHSEPNEIGEERNGQGVDIEEKDEGYDSGKEFEDNPVPTEQVLFAMAPEKKSGFKEHRSHSFV